MRYRDLSQPEIRASLKQKWHLHRLCRWSYALGRRRAFDPFPERIVAIHFFKRRSKVGSDDLRNVELGSGFVLPAVPSFGSEKSLLYHAFSRVVVSCLRILKTIRNSLILCL